MSDNSHKSPLAKTTSDDRDIFKPKHPRNLKIGYFFLGIMAVYISQFYENILFNGHSTLFHLAVIIGMIILVFINFYKAADTE